MTPAPIPQSSLTAKSTNRKSVTRKKSPKLSRAKRRRHTGTHCPELEHSKLHPYASISPLTTLLTTLLTLTTEPCFEQIFTPKPKRTHPTPRLRTQPAPHASSNIYPPTHHSSIAPTAHPTTGPEITDLVNPFTHTLCSTAPSAYHLKSPKLALQNLCAINPAQNSIRNRLEDNILNFSSHHPPHSSHTAPLSHPTHSNNTSTYYNPHHTHSTTTTTTTTATTQSIDSRQTAPARNDPVIIGIAPKSSPLILVIEDEAIGRETLKLVLKNYTKSRFILAENGKQALELYRRYVPKLTGVFMDIMLPDINGFDLFTTFKTISSTKPIIAFTAHQDDTTIEQLFTHGFFGHLGKPYTQEELFGKCNTLLLTQEVSP